MPRDTERREPMPRARITRAEREEIEDRARTELGDVRGAFSEITRLGMRFWLTYMPPGWNPEGDPLTGTCHHCSAALEWDGVWRDAEDLNPGCPVNLSGHVPEQEDDA